MQIHRVSGGILPMSLLIGKQAHQRRQTGPRLHGVSGRQAVNNQSSVAMMSRAAPGGVDTPKANDDG